MEITNPRGAKRSFSLIAAERTVPNAAVPALIRLLDEDDGDLQRGVIEALASLGPRARAAVPKLRIILKEKREFAAENISPISQRPFRFVPNALVRIQGKDALPFLFEQLSDPDASVDVLDTIGMFTGGHGKGLNVARPGHDRATNSCIGSPWHRTTGGKELG